MKIRSSEYYPNHYFISDFVKCLFCFFNLIYMLTTDIELIFRLIFYVRQFCHTEFTGFKGTVIFQRQQVNWYIVDLDMINY